MNQCYYCELPKVWCTICIHAPDYIRGEKIEHLMTELHGKICPNCNGEGWKGYKPEGQVGTLECPKCKGAGRIP